jgi:hypothetical protein
VSPVNMNNKLTRF